MGILKRFQVWPTEVLFFHLSPFLVFVSACCARLTILEWFYITLYIFFSVLSYWIISIHLKRKGRLEAWWREHVLSERRKRVSVGIVIIFLDTFHMLVFLSGLLLVSSNILFIVERSKGVATWGDALYLTLISAGISGFSDLIPRTIAGRFLCVLDSFLGMILIAFWVAIFMKAFEVVFRFFRSG